MWQSNVYPRIFSSFLFFLFASLIPFAVRQLTRTRICLLISLKYKNIIFSQYSPHYRVIVPPPYRFLVIAVVILVTVAHTAVTPRSSHFLDKSKIFRYLFKHFKTRRSILGSVYPMKYELEKESWERTKRIFEYLNQKGLSALDKLWPWRTDGDCHSLSSWRSQKYSLFHKISANLGSWLVSGRESWSHEWIPPPARGLVLEMVKICREKILNNFHQQPIWVPPLCIFTAREPLYHAAHPLTFLYFAKLLSLDGLRGSDNSRAIIFLIILFPAQSSAEPGDCRESGMMTRYERIMQQIL